MWQSWQPWQPCFGLNDAAANNGRITSRTSSHAQTPCRTRRRPLRTGVRRAMLRVTRRTFPPDSHSRLQEAAMVKRLLAVVLCGSLAAILTAADPALPPEKIDVVPKPLA